MDIDTVRSVEQSHFIRSYRMAVSQIKEESRMPENIRMMIRGVNYQKNKEPIKADEIEDKKELDGVPLPDNLRNKFLRLLKD